MNISESEAIQRFNSFVAGLTSQLQDGKTISWLGVGKFSKGLMNEIEFESEETAFAFQQPVVAEKVIRENAKHVVVVGEREKTGSNIAEVLAEPEELKTNRTTWWVWPVILIVLSLFFIAWYFSENGVRASSSSNTEKSIPNEAPQGFNFSK